MRYINLYLFIGADTLRPWGIVQLYCCGFSRLTQKKLGKALPIIPFFDTSYADPSTHNLSLAEKNELRIKCLELFLQEYVVDVQYLNKLSESRATSTSTTDTMNNLNNQVIQDTSVGFNNLNTNTNSLHTPISTTAMRQQQEGLMVTVPSQPSITNVSDTNNTDNLGQQIPLSQ